MKEAGNNVRHLLRSAHHTLDHGFEFFLGLDRGLGDALFDVPPGQFVRVQLRGVGRQEEQFDGLSVIGDKAADLEGLQSGLGPVSALAGGV